MNDGQDWEHILILILKGRYGGQTASKDARIEMQPLISKPPEQIPYVCIPFYEFGGTKHARGQCKPKS